MTSIYSCCTLFLVAASVVLWALAPDAPGAPQGKRGIQKLPFGRTAEGRELELYVLTNQRGMCVKIMTYGGIITELHVPDRQGKLGDVVLGFDNPVPYLKGHPYFGCIAGRVANRIAKATFTLDGQKYSLAVNNGPNALHGGIKGFDKVIWHAAASESKDSLTVKMTYASADGEEGYPGKLTASVAYTLTDENELVMEYQAESDKATPINLTNHSYFNLAGAEKGDILRHQLMLNSAYYTPVDADLIPTGEILKVTGTPLDFLQPRAIGDRIEKLKPNPGGYDHNFVLNGIDGENKQAAEVYEPTTGRVMQVFTTEPGIQLYTGNFLQGDIKGKNDVVYGRHSGLCLETQHYPDSIHHPHFPNSILRPGRIYRQTTRFQFSTR